VGPGICFSPQAAYKKYINQNQKVHPHTSQGNRNSSRQCNRWRGRGSKEQRAALRATAACLLAAGRLRPSPCPLCFLACDCCAGSRGCAAARSLPRSPLAHLCLYRAPAPAGSTGCVLGASPSVAVAPRRWAQGRRFGGGEVSTARGAHGEHGPSTGLATARALASSRRA
jgi:hypothetical protein